MPVAVGMGVSPVLFYSSGISVPLAPTNLTAVQNGSDVDLSWTDNADNEDGYKIYRSSDGVTFAEIDDIAADSTTYTDIAPSSDYYYYYVAAYNAGGESDSNVAEVGVYLLRDDFLTNEAAPLASPRTCEPGPGTLTMVDTVTGADASISGGRYLMPRPTGGQAYTNYGFISTVGFTRSPGLVLYAESESAIIAAYNPVSFRHAGSLNDGDEIIKFASTAQLVVSSGPGAITVAGSLTGNTIYQTMIICRSSGQLFFIRGGSQYPNWTLLMVLRSGSIATLYPNVSNFNSDAKFDTFRLLQRGAPFDSDFGGAAYFDATPTADDVGVGEANGITEFTWTPAAGQTLSIYFRRTDDDNTYRLDCVQAAGTIRLYRRVAALDTELDAGKTQTWTAGIPIRIVIRYHDGEIRTFTEVLATRVAKHVITGETFNLAVTGIKVAGFTAGADFACWPTVWSGSNEWDLA